MKKRKELAIVGMACHFPGGANSTYAFWDMLINGTDAIVNVPESRWNYRKFYSSDESKPGKAHVNQGGFLQEPINEFDPLFFGMSPRDAECLDPQQRFLLETTWEAIESAGLQLDVLQKKQTGVFIGGFCLDNLITQFGVLNRELIDASTPTSSSMAILANRISHVFNFTGPSISLDTACSSSLVATHLGCQSIWTGESDIVIVGGVNIMTRPETSIVMSKGQFLSPLGQCRTFDKDGVGYCRGEGAGIAIIRPLEDCNLGKDRIFAIIKGSGVNQDGHTPGISVPNQSSQETLIRSVYRQSGINANQITYVEAHGTGTQAGDKCEATALDNVLKENRKKSQQCWVGSVKSNIGHLEAAAGIAGLMKASLCLYHRKIPKNLHFDNPNPQIPFAQMSIRVPTTTVSLDEHETNYSAINSFGYGGTNAHVILKEHKESRPQSSDCLKKEPFIFPLSASSDAAIIVLAEQYAQFVCSHSINLNDLLYSTTLRRNHLRHRMAVIANSLEELSENLKVFCKQGVAEKVVVGTMSDSVKPLTFVFTGMGPQRPQMGKRLYYSNTIFKEKIDQCDSIFKTISGWSILQEILKPESESNMSDTRIAQPANFALQVSLVELLSYYGIQPAAVVGHSVGEVAAAYVSGALCLEDALKISFHRSQLQATCVGGAMLAVGLGAENAKDYLSEFEKIDIAAINSPISVTLSGDKGQLEKIAEKLAQDQIFNRFLSVDVAYHSQQMNSIQQQIVESLSDISPRDATLPYFSTVTARQMEGSDLDAAYWWNNIRMPVSFSSTIEELIDHSLDSLIEIGPHPVLRNSIKETHNKFGGDHLTLFHTLHQKIDDDLAFYQCLGQLFTSGYGLNWPVFFNEPCKFIDLPSYPWQKTQFTRESELSIQDKFGDSTSSYLTNHVVSPAPTWETEFSDQFFPFMQDHQINGKVVFPGAAYVELMFHIVYERFKGLKSQIENIQFDQMLIENTTQIQTIRSELNAATKTVSIFSNTHSNRRDWKLHAHGRIIPGAFDGCLQSINQQDWLNQCTQHIDVDALYEQLSAMGLHYGACFQTISQLSVGENTVRSVLQSSPDQLRQMTTPYLNPTLLDGAFQSLIALVLNEQNQLTLYVPVNIKKIKLYQPITEECVCYAALVEKTPKKIKANITLTDKTGAVLAEIEELGCRAIEPSEEAKQQLFYGWDWSVHQLRQQHAQPDSNRKWLIFASGELPIEQAVLSDFINFVNDIRFVFPGDSYEYDNQQTYVIDPGNNDDYKTLITSAKPDQILYLWSIKSRHTPSSQNVMNAVMPMVRLCQAIQRQNYPTHVKLLTINAQKLRSDQRLQLNAAPLWSLSQLIMNECGQIRCSLFDLEDQFSHFRKLTQYLLQTELNEYAFRGNKVYTRTLQPLSLEENNNEQRLRKVCPSTTAIKLIQQKKGFIDSLAFYQSERVTPKDNEVEIQVKSFALNYKDILKAYNRLPDYVLENTYFGDNLGMENSGIITRVGQRVEGIQVGDEVVNPTPDAFQSFITIPTTYVTPKPKPLSFDEAPVMTGYLAALRGIVDIARLQKNEKILIHNATGGVGIAALQIAQMTGAEIYATAGTTEKRQYLKDQGIEHIYDSRTLLFAEEILHDTGGYGVDVVINAIAGDTLYKSFELLAPYGRFIEIGKKDIGENAGLPMWTFNRNITFASVDIDRMFLERVEESQNLLKRIVDHFNRGDFKPNPIVKFSAAEVVGAFKFMAQNKHIGKVVVSMEADQVPALAAKTDKQVVHPSGTYLITGGTGGFGLEVAKWLVAKGAKYLVLCSRRGAASHECKQFLSDYAHTDIHIRAESLDITDKIAVKKLIDVIQSSRHPVRGIFHSAMTLDDGYLMDMTPERFEKVLAVKVDGAMNLFDAIKESTLDYFISFSSISSIIGNPGQANYVVANSFLDQFSEMLRMHNISGITINWGVFLDTGVVKRSKDVKKMLELTGITGFSTSQALTCMQTVIEKAFPQVGVFDVDWQIWSTNNPESATHPKFSKLTGFDNQSDAQKAFILELLACDSREAQKNRVISEIKQQLSKILKIPEDKADTSISISHLGIDSLSTVELRHAIEQKTGVNVKVVQLMEGPSIQELGQFVFMELTATMTEFKEKQAKVA